MKRFLLLSCLVTLISSPGSFAEEVCGEAKLLEGSACSNLQVIFKLSSCGGAESEKATVLCDKEGTKAVIRKESATFYIPLREIAPGVWTLVGALRKYPKGWIPEKKSFPN